MVDVLHIILGLMRFEPNYFYAFMIKLTPKLLKQLEEVFAESGYKVRYEKGNFKSGYCILESKKVVLLNKFSVIETRITILMEIIKFLSAQEDFSGEKFMEYKNKYIDDSEQQELKEEN
jgi:hypothetical protein